MSLRKGRLIFLCVLLAVGLVFVMSLWAAASAANPIPPTAQRLTDDAPASEGVIVTTADWRVQTGSSASYYDVDLEFSTGKRYWHNATVEIVFPFQPLTNAAGVEVLKGVEDRPDAIYYVYFRASELVRVPEEGGKP